MVYTPVPDELKTGHEWKIDKGDRVDPSMATYHFLEYDILVGWPSRFLGDNFGHDFSCAFPIVEMIGSDSTGYRTGQRYVVLRFSTQAKLIYFKLSYEREDQFPTNPDKVYY